MKLPVKRITSDLPVEYVPWRKHSSDAGLDLRSTETIFLGEGATKLVSTGIAVAIPENHAGLILSRSGLASKGVIVANAPGLIDPGYRGEVKVILHRLHTHSYLSENFEIQQGDRIAQLLIVPFTYCLPTLVWELPASTDGRGEGGFGSTGQ